MIFDEAKIVYRSPEEKQRYSSQNELAATMLNYDGNFRVLLPGHADFLNPGRDLQFTLVEIETDSDLCRIPLFIFLQMAGYNLTDMSFNSTGKSKLHYWFRIHFPSTFMGITYRDWQMDQPGYIPNSKQILRRADPKAISPALLQGYIANPCKRDAHDNKVMFTGTPFPLDGIALPVIILTYRNIFAYVNESGAWCEANSIFPRFRPELWEQAICWAEFLKLNRDAGSIDYLVLSFPKI